MKSIFIVLFILITLIVSKAFSAGDPIDVNCVSGCSGGSGGIAGTVGIGGQPIEVKGTVSVDGITFPGTLSVQVLNPQGTVVVSNPQTSVSITGVVNTNGTQVISGPVNTFGTITVGSGTVSIAGVIPTTGTIQLAAGPAVIGSISNTSFGVSGVVNTTGTQSISGVVATVGTQSIAGSVNVNGTMALSANAATAANQSSVISQLGTLNSQLSSGTSAVSVTNPITGFATSAKQDTMISNLGTIGNAVVNGTLNVLAKSEILYGSLAVTAGAMGTLEMDTSNGYSAFRIFNDQSGSDVGTDINWYGTKSGSGPWEPLSCFNVDALDGQFLFGSGYWLGAGFPIDDFVCDISTFQRVRVVAQAGVSGLSLIVGAGKQANTIFGIGSTVFNVDYQWRTVGGDGVTPGPDGNSPTAANSKPVIPATDSQPFPVKGTISCSNCTGSSSSGTTAVSGTVSVAVVGVVNTNGTIVQGAGGSSAWLTTSTGGTLTKVTTIDTITNAVTVNTHAVTGTVGLTGGTIGISGPVNTFGTMNITGGTIGITGPVNTFGTMSITGGTVGIAGVVTTAGTISITGGTVGIAGVVTTAGTLVQGTGGTSAWLTTSILGTLTKVNTIDTITNAVTVNTHAVTGSGVFTTNGTQFVTQLALSPISVSFSESVAAPTAAVWYKRSQWQVPSGSTFLPDKAKSAVTTAGSRTLIGTGVVMGSLNLSSNAFTDASSVSSPRFFSRMLGCVTTVMSATLDNITVTYTDDLGNSHSSVATAFAASSPVGTCFEIPLAATTGAMRDTGFRDVTNITDSAAPTGIIEIIGLNPLHDALGAANAFELSTVDNSVILQNEFVWIFEMQAATTAQQRAAAIEGAIRTP
jgi:fibronectin-binding autotransporter adhesin